MGCGGSRADAIEPRYPESWTRETESTWLTSTEAETPNGGSSSKIHPGCGVEGGMASKENSKVSGSLGVRGWVSGERRMVNAGTQCGKQPLASSTCTNQQRRSRRSCPEVCCCFFGSAILLLFLLRSGKDGMLCYLVRSCFICVAGTRVPCNRLNEN
uniref:BAALC binder of MAP3K1 and KLF4 b n=1 Tax=Astyanax mexicanus TaxID=7994 RepID=W5KVS6_ASTMX